ncbi:VOC family protein [Ornithinibacillus contaminans]|uniref:VOC family protein n=1 Tax=Ornithinibacillus contaminans TaxID=694055 RepID=UPI00064DBE7E|nr:VOC family protein [Ornithinibacillus contaminans]
MFLSAHPDLYTKDIHQALKFYRDLLGFKQTFQFPKEGEPEHVELRLGDSMIAITTNTAAAIGGVSAPTPGHPFQLTVWADDADEEISRLQEAGVPVIIDTHDHKAGNRRAYVTHPDGNWVAIVSRKK